MTPIEDFDLIVLGAGNATALAIRAAKAGWRVALIEKDRLGGTCPNRGCVPSKLLIGHADIASAIRDAARFHMQAELHKVDCDAIFASVKAATFDATDGKIAGALPEGLELVRGHGRFVGERLIEAKGRRFRGQKIVIATGSRPYVPPRADLKGLPYWTSDEVFEAEKAPRSVVLIGGGYIGCELAYVYSALGIETTLLVRDNGLLTRSDTEIRRVFEAGFMRHVDVRLNTELTAVAHDGQRFSLQAKGPDGDLAFQPQVLLFAIGRIPNSDDLGLDLAGVKTTDKGWIAADDGLKTSAEGIYALGDVKGHHLFTHAASFEASWLGDHLLEQREGPLDYGPMPSAVFTRPEVASVGATEEELRERGIAYRASCAPYSSAAKGRAVKEEHGLVKFLLSPKGEILGCHIVGHEASVLLHEVIPVMKWKNHITSLKEIIHIHPSLSEVVRNAARKAASGL